MPAYSVPPANALLTQDGGIGIIFVPEPLDFKVGMLARLVSDTQEPMDVRVAGVHPETGAVTILNAQGGFGPDATAYRVSDGARAIADSQIISSDAAFVNIAGQSGEVFANVFPRDPDPEVYIPVRLTNGASFYNATGGGSGGGTVDQGMAGTDPWPVKGPLTDSQLRANPVGVTGSVTIPGTVDVSGIILVSNFPVTQPVSGTVNVAAPGTLATHYDEVAAVGSGVETDILSVTAPPSGLRLRSVMASGDNVAVFRVKVDGSTIATKRTGWTSPNADFTFDTGVDLTSGQVLTVTGLHNRPTTATFEACAVTG